MSVYQRAIDQGAHSRQRIHARLWPLAPALQRPLYLLSSIYYLQTCLFHPLVTRRLRVPTIARLTVDRGEERPACAARDRQIFPVFSDQTQNNRREPTNQTKTTYQCPIRPAATTRSKPQDSRRDRSLGKEHRA